MISTQTEIEIIGSFINLARGMQDSRQLLRVPLANRGYCPLKKDFSLFHEIVGAG